MLLVGPAHVVFAFFCSVGLVALATLLGSRLIVRMPLTTNTMPERSLLAAGLGLGFLSYLAFLLGVISQLTPNIVRIALLLATVLAAADWRLAKRGGPVAGSEDRCAPGVFKTRVTAASVEKRAAARPDSLSRLKSFSGRWDRALVLLIGLILLAGLVTCLTPIIDADGLSYHAAAPKRWLELGFMSSLPTHLHAQWPMGGEMLFTLLLPVGGPDACKPLMALVSAMAACAVWMLGTKLASSSAGLIAAALFVACVSSPLLAPGINSTSIEIALALFVTLSAIALVNLSHARTHAERRAWLTLAAAAAGFCCCIKLNGLLFLAFLTPAAAILSGIDGMPARFRAAGSFALIAILCASPWYLRNWWDNGSPFYPFAYSLLGGRNWNAGGTATLSAYFHTFNLPGDTLQLRHAVILRHLFKLSVVTLAAVFLPGPRWLKAIALAAGAFALLQVTVSDQWRFLLPALPFAVIVPAYWIDRGAIRFPALGWSFAGILAVSMLPGQLKHAAADVPVAISPDARMRFIHRYSHNRNALQWANAHLPPSARVLYGPDTMTYYLEREVYWSDAIFQHQILYDTPGIFQESLKRAGITHLILNRPLYNNPTVAFEVRTWRTKERLRLEEEAARSTKLWEKDGVAIYEVGRD